MKEGGGTSEALFIMDGNAQTSIEVMTNALQPVCIILQSYRLFISSAIQTYFKTSSFSPFWLHDLQSFSALRVDHPTFLPPCDAGHLYMALSSSNFPVKHRHSLTCTCFVHSCL